MTQSRVPLHACSYVEEVFAVLGKRWSGLVIDLLLQRPARFNEIHTALPHLSNRVLSDRLVELQEAGLVLRDVDPGPPVTVTYRLTDRGQQLGPAMDALRVWAGAPTDEHGAALPYSAVVHQSDEAG